MTALRELKFKKIVKKASVNGAHVSEVPVASGSSTPTYQLPTQSRDGSTHPPYLASGTPRNHGGIILAPDSSPSSSVPPVSPPTMTFKPHQSHFFSSVIPPGPLPSLPRLRPEHDPLSAPSGFIRSAQSSKIPDPRPSVSPNLGKHLDDDDDDPGPPRKRINRRGSSLNPIAIDSSPEVKRPFTSASNTHLPPRDDLSDSDSLPNAVHLLSGETKSRIVKGRRPDIDEEKMSVELNTLVFTHPFDPKARVISAFNLCDGDVKAAATLIQDPTWQHEIPSSLAATPPPSTSTTPSINGSGDRRAAEREKGKKSMIYAKRQGLVTSQVNGSPKEPMQRVVDSGLSPLAPKPPKRKATKKQRIDSSGSEAEYSEGTDTDTKDGVFSQNREDQYYEVEALKWLNECEAGALVELTGDFLMTLISKHFLIR